MKKPPAKMFLHLNILFLWALILPFIKAAPSADSLPSSSSSLLYSSSGFISSPSIYSYTIENQLPTNQTTTTIYQQKQQPKQLASTNRNLYYSSSNTNLNSNNKHVMSSTTSSTSTMATSSMPLPSLEATQPAPVSDCTLDRLAVYKVVLHTYWTRELFPKHYPDWRPTAQWTKTVGKLKKIKNRFTFIFENSDLFTL